MCFLWQGLYLSRLVSRFYDNKISLFLLFLRDTAGQERYAPVGECVQPAKL
jgi:hypothetical protein